MHFVETTQLDKSPLRNKLIFVADLGEGGGGSEDIMQRVKDAFSVDFFCLPRRLEDVLRRRLEQVLKAP